MIASKLTLEMHTTPQLENSPPQETGCTFSTRLRNKSVCNIEVVKNGAVKDIEFADAMDHNDRALSSTMTILSLEKGDVVHVRVGLLYGGYYLESNQYVRMTFSGFKLA